MLGSAAAVVSLEGLLEIGTAAARQRGAAATLRRASPGSGQAARLAHRALPGPGRKAGIPAEPLQGIGPGSPSRCKGAARTGRKAGISMNLCRESAAEGRASAKGQRSADAKVQCMQARKGQRCNTRAYTTWCGSGAFAILCYMPVGFAGQNRYICRMDTSYRPSP